MTVRDLIERIQAMPKHVLDKEVCVEFDDDDFLIDDIREGDSDLAFVVLGDPYNHEEPSLPGVIPGVTCCRPCDGVIRKYAKEDGSVVFYCPVCHWNKA
jgi:hypothetical protein